MWGLPHLVNLYWCKEYKCIFLTICYRCATVLGICPILTDIHNNSSHFHSQRSSQKYPPTLDTIRLLITVVPINLFILYSTLILKMRSSPLPLIHASFTHTRQLIVAKKHLRGWTFWSSVFMWVVWFMYVTSNNTTICHFHQNCFFISLLCLILIITSESNITCQFRRYK